MLMWGCGVAFDRTHALGRAVGLIYVVMLVVDVFFFAFLEWLIPREDIDYVPEECDWDVGKYETYRIRAEEKEKLT